MDLLRRRYTLIKIIPGTCQQRLSKTTNETSVRTTGLSQQRIIAVSNAAVRCSYQSVSAGYVEVTVSTLNSFHCNPILSSYCSVVHPPVFHNIDRRLVNKKRRLALR